MKRDRRRRCLVLEIAFLSTLAQASTADEVLVFSGDTVPGTGGLTIESLFFGSEGENADGDIVLDATLAPGSVSSVLELSARTLSKTLLAGEIGPLGGAYEGFCCPVLSENGDLTFLADEVGFAPGMYQITSVGIAPLLLYGDPVPGHPGLTFDHVRGDLVANASGDVAFRASYRTESGIPTAGLFRTRSGSVEVVALRGDPAPPMVGGTYAFAVEDDAFFMDDAGTVVFDAIVVGGNATAGLFRAAGGPHAVLVLAGEPAPETNGGTFSSFRLTRLNAEGDLVFFGQIAGATAAYGVFVLESGGPRAVALEGEAAPGTSGATFGVFFDLDIDDTGMIAFRSNLVGGSFPTNTSTSAGIFVDSALGVELIAVVGDPAPIAPTAYYTWVTNPSLKSSGEITFRAEVGDATGPLGHGVFVPEPGGVPSLIVGVLSLAMVSASRSPKLNSNGCPQ